MMLTNLADVCRRSGLPVVEVDGWQSRGHGQMASVRGIVLHHTATSASAPGDYPSLRIVRDGRDDLPGPLANLGLGRNGTVYVIAAGKAWHAGAVIDDRATNENAIGIEAEHPGTTPHWAAGQYAAYVRLVATLSTAYDWQDDPGTGDDAAIFGHKEVNLADGKIDPTFDMDRFRADVAAFKSGRRMGAAYSMEEDDMPFSEADLRRIFAEALDANSNLKSMTGGVLRKGDKFADKTTNRVSTIQEIADTKTYGIRNAQAIEDVKAQVERLAGAVDAIARKVGA